MTFSKNWARNKCLFPQSKQNEEVKDNNTDDALIQKDTADIKILKDSIRTKKDSVPLE